MKILVPIKRVLDYTLKPKITSQGTIDIQGMKLSINPFDEIALEEALRLREQGWATEVSVFTHGSKEDQEVLRHGLALGADRAFFSESTTSLDSFGFSEILVQVIRAQSPDLVLMGKQSIDTDASHVPQMVAGLLGWPQGLFASKIEANGTEITVTQELDHGLEVLSFSTPGVISADLRLNTPRFATLPNIMKARTKAIEALSLEPPSPPVLETLSVNDPLPRKQGQKVGSVSELVQKLKEEGVWS